MAKQTGPFNLEGTIGNVIFYKRNGKYYSRSKGSPSRKKLKHGKEFENSRRVSSEFGHASKFAAKLSRSCVGLLNPGRHDGLHGRMTASLQKVLQTDPVSEYGSRRLRFGNLDLMVGFDFEAMPLKRLLISLPTLSQQGQIAQIDFTGTKSLVKNCIPAGATHYRVDFVCCRMNEVSAKTANKRYEGKAFGIDASLELIGMLELDFGSELREEEILFIVMGIVFLQEVNGKMNELVGKRAVGVLKGIKGDLFASR
ncbi:hypothetical protein A33Q_3455 [Indibacter alkaliphilus LW1]|uniref:Uncharacterized protein n=1 Tax=Indibacter alkaliphilus (strain CCUG 57479 / KCTC 22604 / LW1) TaxID=1189612 RepID=S2DA34_INDAL|nr:hypothetical protein [Indibacter alkaliphilus]EOZ93850.1 hypothetical protein A33Q_3455 [Indibacter alkaliphilus LW1]